MKEMPFFCFALFFMLYKKRENSGRPRIIQYLHRKWPCRNYRQMLGSRSKWTTEKRKLEQKVGRFSRPVFSMDGNQTKSPTSDDGGGMREGGPSMIYVRGVLIQWKNNEVGLPLLSPTGPDGLGWQIRQRMERETVQLPARKLERAGEWRRFGRGLETLTEGSQKQGASVARLHQRDPYCECPSDWLDCPSLIRNIAFLTLFSLENERLSRASLPRVQWRADRYSSPHEILWKPFVNVNVKAKWITAERYTKHVLNMEHEL